ELGPLYKLHHDEHGFGMIKALPLPMRNLERGPIPEAEARREHAGVAIEVDYEKRLGLFHLARDRLTSLKARRETLEETLLPLAGQRCKNIRRDIELGKSSGLVLLESLVREHELRIQRIELRRDEQLTLIELEELTGPFPGEKERT
ncbi:MAG: hypothetical protein AAF492_06285, partial [Verrucomicrobiota bacterium]